ncbi:C-C motif chemokine 20b [Chanos chanos]|uniref:C-C motif chemokine 20b n=1 Tax=Chanos chanos TaxID=29144 RepID=A0A6J2V0T9_CHACN|nr:monocyte chemotactic protein 1B-like [Chanos chanos]
MLTSKKNATFIIILFILKTFVQETESASCCLSYTKRTVRCQRLKGYTIQNINSTCDIKAIIFHTVNGKYICADPSKMWTQHRIDCLKKKAVNIGGNAESPK